MLRPAVLLAATLLLAGCVPSQPIITPAPEPSATPIFASDEDALAAATAAYAKYVSVTDEVFASGGVDLNPLSSVLAGKQLKVEADGFATVQQEGWHSVGATKFDTVQLQQYSEAPDGFSIVVVYLCEDISGTDVIGPTGSSVVAKDLAKRSFYEVTFDLKPETSSLLVSDKKLWGSGKC